MRLRRFHIDQLPSGVKLAAAKTIANAIEVANHTAEEIDELLRMYAKSPLIDPDPDSEQRAKKRAEKLADWKILYPGIWRARAKQTKGRLISKKRRMQ